MTIDPAAPSSRRALLAAALGAGAATVAAMLRPLTTRAADGQPMIIGGSHIASTVTKVDTAASGAAALWGVSQSGNGVTGSSGSGPGLSGYSASGHGVVGQSDAAVGATPAAAGIRGISAANKAVYGTTDSGLGVHGLSLSGTGVWGESTTGPGVAGTSNSSHGVGALSNATAQAAMIATSQGGSTGVLGFSGYNGSQPVAPRQTGVYGYAAQDSNARGVTGQTTSGRGVYGAATTGTGVHAYATTGIALRAIGRVKLDDCAGVATIASGASSVVVTPGVDLVSTSAVVATLMGNAGGSTAVKRVAVNTTANTLTIYLTANSTAAVKVAWHVFG